MEAKVKGRKKSMAILVIGTIIVAGILVIGTLFTGRRASDDTSEAVRNVSLLYLDELAGRREQVVESVLNDYISDIDVALGLMEPGDIESVESFQRYQSKIKQMYGLEKFAFVDVNGTIYTSRGTRTDIDVYDFDYNTISEPEISVKNLKGQNKKVVIAVPVDRVLFNNTTLVTCFIEIDMGTMLSGISLQANNNTTFCNIYTKDGISLADTVLGGLASENNLLSAMEHANFDKGYSLEDMQKNFLNGTKGVVSFNYNGISETLYYVPVSGTDWMLTYLIRESVISEQINTISDGIIARSLALSVTAAVILAGFFIMVIVQNRRNAKAKLDREISETENRVRQEELEEQLALQEELLEQEKQRTQQNSMITALASDYRSVYYVDLDNDEGICYQNDETVNDDMTRGKHFHFASTFTEYAETCVDEEYRDGFLEFIKPSNIREKLSNEQIISYRYLIHRDGRKSYEMLRMAGVRHAEDRADHRIHAIGVGFTDIDEEMRDSLAKSQALSDALKAANEANRAKTIFLSNMSHEIRTPMNAIIGLDNLALNEEDISETIKDYLEKIGVSAKHLLSLINDILDMSRIESGRMVLKSEEFKFATLLEQINTIVSGQCKDKGLNYNCNIQGLIDDSYIGDSTKLKQVLINILGNAVKFTPEGGSVNFEVEKIGSFDNKSTIRFTIADNGIGMSKDFIPKLFDSFSQEDDTAANKYGSSGLGMSITKNIVEMMNGTIEVSSEKDVGTTFVVTVTLPEAEESHALENNDIEINTSEMSVLVVDDDDVACDHAKLVIEKAGIAVDVAHSGDEALEMIKLKQARMEAYNLIVVDWQMPEKDGIETTKQIRDLIGEQSAIIILTAYNWDDIFDEAKTAGVDSFISKPLFAANLIDEFKNALKKKSISKENNEKTLEGRKILVAEDVELNARILMKTLQQKKINSEHALNGKIALDMFESKPEGYYDAILMDMRMPEMDGIEATEHIRGLNRADAKNIPIIALTANAFDEDVQRSLQAGLNAHLTKPIDPKILFQTLEKYLG